MKGRFKKMNNEYFIAEGIRRAQRIGQQGKFKTGQLVAHPSEMLVCEFLEERNGMAILALPAEKSPTGKAVEKEFPLDEILDANIALEQALDAKSEAIAAKLPPGAIVIRLGR